MTDEIKLEDSLGVMYKKLFKTAGEYAWKTGYFVLSLAPLLLFFAHICIISPEEPSWADTGLAFLVNIVYAPWPLWFYFKDQYNFKDYMGQAYTVVAVSPLIALAVFMIIFLPLMPAAVAVIVCLATTVTLSPLAIVLLIIGSFLWLPAGFKLLNLFFKIIPG